LVLILSSCPESTTIPLAPIGTVKIDKKLIGTWQTNYAEQSIEKFTISEYDKNSYMIKAVVYDFMAESKSNEDYIAWIVNVNDKKFIVAQRVINNELNDYFYLFYYTFEKGNLELYTINIDLLALAEIKTSEEYMKIVKTKLSNPDPFKSQGIYSRK
jgi:fumarate hydratase class II